MAFLMVALANGVAPARADERAPAELTKSWSVQVDAAALRLLDGPTLRQLRRARASLILEPEAAARTRRAAERISGRHRLPLIQPAPSAEECLALKVARPGSRCAVTAATAEGARTLAASGEADLVIVPARSAKAFRSAAASRIVAVLPLRARGYRSAKWRAELAAAKRAEATDLAVHPAGAGAKKALTRLLATLVPVAKRGDRSAPSAPAPVQVEDDGMGLRISWSAAADKGGVAGYGVYLGGRRVAASRGAPVTIATLGCGLQLVEVDAVDRSGNRSAKAFTVSAGRCGLSSTPPAVLVAPAPSAPPTPPPRSTATPTATATATSAPVLDRRPPTMPAGLAVTEATRASIALEWTASHDDTGVAGYRLFRDGALVSTTAASTAVVTSLTCGTQYVFAVEAFDAAGNASARATLTASTQPCGDVTPPTMPGGLNAAATEFSIRLEWTRSTDDEGVTGYFVYRDGRLVDATVLPEATLADLECGTGYELGVAARDAAGNLSAVATLVASTLPCSDQTPPSAPTGLTVAATTPTSVSLSWEPSNDDVAVTGYQVDRDGTLVESVTETAAVVTGLVCETRYEFGVRARDAAKNLSGRVTVSAATAECPDVVPPSQPAAARVVDAGQGWITLAWDASEDDRGVTHYRVYRDGRRVASSAGTSVTIPGLACETAFVFGIEARDAAANASPRAQLEASTGGCKQPEPEPATLFVAPAGSDTGDCSRQSPCQGFDRAYEVSKPGDVVEVAAGSYGRQQLYSAPGHDDGPDVRFRPAPGAHVVLEELSFGEGDDARTGPDRITVRGMSLLVRAIEPGAGSQAGIFVGGGASHITLEQMDAGNIHVWKAEHVTVRGGDYGPCDAVWPYNEVCGTSKIDVASDVTIDGARFHHYRFDETCFADGADCHYECLYINGGTRVSVVNSSFRECAVFDIFATLSGADAGTIGHRELTIANNAFAAPWMETPEGGTPTRSGAVALAWCENGPEIGYANVRVAFNSFEETTGIEVADPGSCVWKDVRVVGNLATFNGCVEDDDGIKPGWSYAFNVWTPGSRAGTCSPTDETLAGGVLPYVRGIGSSGMDFHLDADSVADDLVPAAAGCPDRDVDGQVRPAVGSACDAGFDER